MCASAASLLAPETWCRSAVTRRLQRVDPEHRVTSSDQRGHPWSAVGLDPDHHLHLITVGFPGLSGHDRV
jgi:hypothetical protein